jgi:hypothetical protein
VAGEGDARGVSLAVTITAVFERTHHFDGAAGDLVPFATQTADRA